MEIYDETQVDNQKQVTKVEMTSSLALVIVYLWFALGLLITAIGLPYLITDLYGGTTAETETAYYTVIIIISLVLFIPSSFATSFSALSKHSWLIATFYIIYALPFGGLLSFFTLIFTDRDDALCLPYHRWFFWLDGILGYITKGKIDAPILLLVALVFGLTIISIFNLLLFNGSSYYMYYLIISIVILVIFLLIVAVDTNTVIRTAQSKGFDNSNTMVIYAAYCLYSDFIIIFMYVLRILTMFS